MTHIRESLRDRAVVTLTGLATTGTNVFGARVYPVAATALPALLVFTEEEEPFEEGESMGNDYVMDMVLVVRVLAAAVTEVEDQSDLILEEVQTAWGTDRTLNALAMQTRYIGRSETEYSTEGDREHATFDISFFVRYEVTI